MPALPPPPATTVFERMSALARETGAINLGQGFPEMEEPAELLDAARRALVERPNQYPPMRGLAELRQAICGYYDQSQGLTLTPDEVVVTSGATEALAACILAFVRPGDEVIALQPLYDAYVPLIERAGGTARLVNLTPPDWRVPAGELRAAITAKTRMILANTPHNPTGAMLSPAELAMLGELCAAHDLILVCDEVWEGMTFGAAPHVSPLTLPALRERAVKIGSAGKIFSLTGWKVGWAVAAPPLAALIAAQHQFLTFTTPPPLQWAVAEGLALPPAWHHAHRARYGAARQRLIGGLEAAGFAVLPSQGTWFVTIDLAASGLEADDEAIARRLVHEAGVASIPVSAFYAEQAEKGYLRLCFTKEDHVLNEAIARLARFRTDNAA